MAKATDADTLAERMAELVADAWANGNLQAAGQALDVATMVYSLLDAAGSRHRVATEGLDASTNLSVAACALIATARAEYLREAARPIDWQAAWIEPSQDEAEEASARARAAMEKLWATPERIVAIAREVMAANDAIGIPQLWNLLATHPMDD